ncbi:hypothetical protein [Massilia pseudoviolaceinigra]|uniref:hypothetical protein n=1 Tax=Massilia pseudoviolaceinigra TaxID=3057165 RepID=UPI0027967580|nr:hypothetical protein [Massilia sp. CCM 9206]MDQ1921455.1 hypothetical protein [Massilia sp. CCM 9206]
MRDHSHHSTENTGYCEHCGQPLPGYAVPSYEIKRFNSVGIAVTVLLHVLLVLLWVFKPQDEKKAPPPPSGADMVYVMPLPQSKPQPREQPKVTPKPTTQARPDKPTVAKVRRLPNTITIPNEKPAKEVDVPEPPKPVRPTAVAPETDMAAAIEARRRARGQTESEPAEESAAERGMRIAKANIAAANGRSQGDDRNDTGGVFEVKKNSMSATVKFRGWNPSFKRRWLQEVTVELGNEKDIETAVIKKMIEIIRKEKTGDFEWDSHRLQRVVKMSARVEDTAELSDFLYKEMFPETRRGR